MLKIFKLSSILLGAVFLSFTVALYFSATKIQNPAILTSVYLKYAIEFSIISGFFFGVSFVLFLEDEKGNNK